MGVLYVVDVPLDNPEDVTLRALRVLREACCVVAHDVSRAQKFLACYEIDTPLAGYTAGEGGRGQGSSEIQAVLEALDRGDVALLSETGRPGSTMPVHRLVRTAMAQGVSVLSVPGPSAAVTALVLSGLPMDAFVCLGSLPRRGDERRALLASLAAEPRTAVAFEKPGRLPAALGDLAKAAHDRPLALVPVETGPDREVWRGMVHEALSYVEANPPRGECALVIGGATKVDMRWPERRVRSELALLLAEGLGRKAAVRQVAQVSGWRPREVYRLAVEARAGGAR
jgi:16S rRNA (cytidine1402-2'-O)-methyltransferase